MPRLSDLGALRLVDPSEWKKRIKAAMRDSNGRIGDAAVKLGVGERQLYRWLAEPVLSDVKRAEMGLPRDGRRGRRKVEEEIVIPSRRKKVG